MRIAMFTNTYLPQVGGVAKSVERFSRLIRERGHEVLVIAPSYRGETKDSECVHRVPALKEFDGSDFSVALPVDFDLGETVDAFGPDLVHAHHPFLLGNTALRYAAPRHIPLVFTHHTMYEHYTHYVPVELATLKDYVVRMASGFANFCDAVVAPSESTASILKRRGVSTPIRVVPTGVDVEGYRQGDGLACRSRVGIANDAFLIGTVGRLAPEKNLGFLAEGVAQAMKADEQIGFVAIGDGPARQRMKRIFENAGVADRAYFAGVLDGQALRDAYHALDLFVFASKTETQGMVLVEAMAADCPVVALDAPGAREVVNNGENGRLVSQEDEELFRQVISDVVDMPEDELEEWRAEARKTASNFSTEKCADRLLDVYEEVRGNAGHKDLEGDEWQRLASHVKREWDIWSNRIRSFGEAMLAQESDSEKDST